MANDYYSGLPSFLTPRDPGHTPGTPWTVRMPDGTFQEVPWNEAGLHVYERHLGGGNYENTATSDPAEIAHKERQFSTANNQAALKIAAMLGGGAWAANALGPVGATNTATHVATASDIANGVAEGATAAGSASSAIPAGVADVMTVTAPAVGGIAPGVLGGVTGGLAGASAITSGGGAATGPNGLPTADTPPPGAYQASGEYQAPEGPSSGGWQDQIKRLFHMGGNGQQQRQPYQYQNPQVADYAQQQQAAEMLAEALNKRQPVDPIVRGGPIPIGRY